MKAYLHLNRDRCSCVRRIVFHVDCSFRQMLVLWEVRVQGGNGREIYGEHYSDIWAINRLHFKAASLRVCDHVSHGAEVSIVGFQICGKRVYCVDNTIGAQHTRSCVTTTAKFNTRVTLPL